MANQATIDAMKAWCKDNYENGADTIVECWSTGDYVKLIDETCLGSESDAWKTLKAVASIYRERQADAEFHRSQAG